MKKLLFLFVLSFHAVFAYSQQVKWSPVIDDKDNNYLKIIGQNEEGFYVLKSNISFGDDRDKVGFRARRYNLSFYTDEMIMKWSRNIESPFIDGKIVSVNMVNERVLVTHSFSDKKQKIYRLYVEYLNSNGTFQDSSRLILETTYGKLDEEKPDIYVSQNQSIIACGYKTMPAGKEQQDFHIIMMDSSLSVLYKKDFTAFYNEKKFESHNLVLSNDGGFYLFGLRYTNDKKIKAPGESFYMAYYCTHASDAIHTKEIRIDNRFLTDASLTYDNINHKMVVAGFYSDVSAYSVAGTFYYGLRTDTIQKAEVRTSAFSPQFLNKFRGEIREGNKELIDYSINRIILRRDGGAVIIAEAFTTTYSSYYDYFSQMYVTHRYYTYGNIITLSVNPDGTILWSNSLSKSQESRDDGGYYSSYCGNIYENKMHFIYNKYIKDNPSVLLSSVDFKGDQKTDVLFNEEEHVMAIPAAGKQIAEDEVVMPALKEGKLRFVKITF